MRFSGNPEKNTAVIWFVISAGSVALILLFAAVIPDPLSSFGRFFALIALGNLSFLGLIIGIAFFLRSRKFDAFISGKDILARWSYHPDEIEPALADERKRQKKLRAVILFFVILILGMGVLFCYAWGTWDYVAISEYILLFLTTLVFIYAGLPAMGFGPANATECILGKDGVLFAGRFHLWKAWGSRLTNVNYQPGKPGKIWVQYTLAAEQGPQVINLSIPVPAGREYEAEAAVRALVQ
jgi:hypothetical protein